MRVNDYTLGLVSVSFRQHSPKEILQAMRSAGLSAIEWGSDIHAPCADREKLHQIAALQKQYGILCCSYGTYFRLGETPIEELEAYIDAAEILGTDILRLWCGRKSGAAMTPQERSDLVAICQSAAAIAQARGMKLCMECHKNTFTEKPDDALWLMETVNSPCFRMYWQPFQWQNPKENLENAGKLASCTEHIHVFHWQGNQRLPLADATEQWHGYLKQFTTPRTLLLEFMPDDQITSLPMEANALKTIIGELL